MFRKPSSGRWLWAIAVALLISLVGLQSPSWAAVPVDGPVVEWLTFAVPIPEQTKFIEQELAIWNPIDKQSPAFVRKEIFQNEADPGQLTVVVYWSNQASRKTVSPETVKAAEQAFGTAMGKTYDMIEKREFRLLSSSQ